MAKDAVAEVGTGDEAEAFFGPALERKSVCGEFKCEVEGMESRWRLGEIKAYLDYAVSTFTRHDGLLERWVDTRVGMRSNAEKGV